jgi:hypothetical protein
LIASRRVVPMTNNELLPAIAADILSAIGPGGSTLQALASAHLAKRRTEATEILIQELKNGHHGEIDFNEHDIDPMIEIILRFSKAVDEGSARENLMLLAQVIAGLKKGNKILEPDKFRKWCGILEQLTQDELNVIGTAYRVRKELSGKGDADFKDLPKPLKEFLSSLEMRLRQV